MQNLGTMHAGEVKELLAKLDKLERMGIVRISKRDYAFDPKRYMTFVTAELDIYQQHRDAEDDTLVLYACSPHFDRLSEGMDVPEYRCKIDYTKSLDSTPILTWERVK